MMSKIIEMTFKLKGLGELDNDEYRFKILIDRLIKLLNEEMQQDAWEMMRENDYLYNRVRVKSMSETDFKFPARILLIYYNEIKRQVKRNRKRVSVEKDLLQLQLEFKID